MNNINLKKEPSSSWTAFGKFSAVIFLVSAIIAILQFTFSLNKKDAKITYSLKFMEYHKSPEKTSRLKSNDYVLNENNILNFEMDKDEYSSMYGHFLELEVGNKGKKTAEELIINFPFNGVYYIIYHNGEVKKGEFTKQILIGSLKINEKCKIYIWTEKYTSLYHIEKINYAYDTGSGNINYPLYIYNSFLKFILEDPFFFVLLLFFYTLVVFLLFFSFGISVASGKKNVSVSEEKTTENEKIVDKDKEIST